jgi:hypothetical protein
LTWAMVCQQRRRCPAAACCPRATKLPTWRPNLTVCELTSRLQWLGCSSVCRKVGLPLASCCCSVLQPKVTLSYSQQV